MMLSSHSNSALLCKRMGGSVYLHPEVQLLSRAAGDSLKDSLQVVHISEAASMSLPVREGEHLQHNTTQHNTSANTSPTDLP
jgi:hypothetical protein